MKLGAKSFPSPVSKSTDMVVHGRKGGKKLIKAHELLDKDKIQDEIDFFFLAEEKGFIHKHELHRLLR